MNKDRYPIISNEQQLIHEFLSEGPNGVIKKVIKFQKFTQSLYNLSFGDLNGSIGDIDTLARTNNFDQEKIFTTVATTVVKFISYYPHVNIFISGSTPARTRLYQIKIFSNLPEITALFNVEGYINGQWEAFKTNRSYRAFLFRPK